MDLSLRALAPVAAHLFEGAGILVMVFGAALAPVLAMARFRGPLRGQRYHAVRRYLGSAIMLGLELLVAADIIRTVTEAPTFQAVAVLGLIVLIRTFLSFTLEVELEGRWPWGPRNVRG